MKKLFLSFGIFLPAMAFAITFPSSGIDFDASFVAITGPTGAPCLNKTLGETAQAFSFTEMGLGEKINEIGNFGDWDNATQRCFQKAGGYTVSVSVFDRAGNITVSPASAFTITSADPDQEASSFEVTCKDDPVANAEDECVATLSLSDEFRNPVTQTITDIALSKISVSPSFTDDDANLGIKFYDGLALDASSSEWDYGAETAPSFRVKAVAPSIAKVQTGMAAPDGTPVVLSTVVERETPFFIANLKKIALDGTTSPESFSFNGLAAPLRFDVPLAIMPQFRQGDTIESEKIKLNDPIKIYGVPVLTKEITLSSVVSWAKNVSKNLFADPEDVDAYESAEPAAPLPSPWGPLYENVEFPVALENFEQKDLEELFAEKQIIFEDAEDTSLLVPQNISLTTTAEYSFDGFSNMGVEYIAGAMGAQLAKGAMEVSGISPEQIVGFNDKTVFLNIGISVEGLVIRDQNQTSAGDSITATFLTDYKPIDIREKIVKNAYQLIRNASAIIEFSEPGTHNFTDAHWEKFENQDVVVVDLSDVEEEENATLELKLNGSKKTLPVGQKTLIVVNGNVLIASDLEYEKKNDSFGLILLRDKSGPEPTRGNIFVHEGVQKLSGTFFADGSFFGTDQPNGDLLATANMGARSRQLLLTGSLLSKNTIGGSTRSYTGPGSGTVFSPWGGANQSLAKKYDLHEVRQYDANDPGADGNCVKYIPEEGAPGECDPNDGSFVLRLDQKAIILPPPGFLTK